VRQCFTGPILLAPALAVMVKAPVEGSFCFLFIDSEKTPKIQASLLARRSSPGEAKKTVAAF
jgi:hypothetical protein